MLKTSPSNVEGAGWIPHASGPKNQNIKYSSNIVTNSKKLKKWGLKKNVKKILKQNKKVSLVWMPTHQSEFQEPIDLGEAQRGRGRGTNAAGIP